MHTLPLLLALLIVGWAGPAWAAAAQPSARPSLVVLLADDLGYGDLGVHGSVEIPTPRLDSLAGEGARFSAAYSAAATCSPARAALLTGRYPQRFGFEFNTGPPDVSRAEGRGLPGSETTLATRLARVGYATGLVGKWHLGNADGFHPLERGFQSFWGFLGGSHPYLPGGRSRLLRGREPVAESEYLTRAIAREAVRFIDAHRAEPFFLLVSFNAVHTPLEAPPGLERRFAGLAPEARRTYAAMLTSLDAAVGRILRALDAHGLAERTVVWFVNDNGGESYRGTASNAGLRLGKAFLFEGGVRTPMLLRWPGVAQAGSVVAPMVSMLDVAPTLAAAAGLPAPDDPPFDGRDLRPWLDGGRQDPVHEALFWRAGASRAVRRGDWKLVRSRDAVWLYDLSADPDEERDLSTARPAIVEELSAALRAWESGLAKPAWPHRPGANDVEIDGKLYRVEI